MLNRGAFVCLSFVAVTAFADAKSDKLYKEGLAAGNAGDLAKAQGLFEQAVKADPKDALSWFDLGGAFEAQKMLQRALDAYLKAAEARPEFVEAQSQAGTLMLTFKRDYPSSLMLFKRALLPSKAPYIDARFSLDHTRGQAFRNAAVAHAQMGEIGVASAIAESALHTDGIDHMVQDGTLAMLVRRTAGGISQASARPNAELGAVTGAFFKDMKGQAGATLQSIGTLEPKLNGKLTPIEQWDLSSAKGIALAMTGKGADADKAFEAAAEASKPLQASQRVEALFNVACSKGTLGKVDDALKALDEALWIRWATKNAEQWKGKKLLTDSIAKDGTLAAVRKDARLAQLLATYNGPGM